MRPTKLGDLIERARPRPESPTYQRITRQINDSQYRMLLNEERRSIGLPEIKKGQAASAE